MTTSSRLLPLLMLATVLVAAPACASGGIYPQRYPAGARVLADREYDRGFRDGARRGEQDARRGRAYDIYRHREYRNADNRAGVRDTRIAVNAFRSGFEAGYDQGYRRYARGGFGYPPAAGGRTPGYPPNAGRGPGYPPARQGWATPAWDNGYRDGYEQGVRDGRDGDRFDPVRARRYRDGDHDYDRRYGSRDDYKRDYRAGFVRGYEDGYRRR